MKARIASVIVVLSLGGCGTNTSTREVKTVAQTEVRAASIANAPQSTLEAEPTPPAIPKAYDEIRTADFTPNGRLVVIGLRRFGSDVKAHGGYIQIFDVKTRKLKKSWRVDDGINDVDVSPDNRTLAIASNTLVPYSSGRVTLWDISGRLRRSQNKRGGDAEVAFTPDGKFLASTAGGFNLRNVKTWKVQREFKDASADLVHAIEISPNGKKLAATYNYNSGVSLALLDTRNGRLLWTAKVGDGLRVAFSSNSRRLVLTRPGAFYFYEVRGGKRLRTIEHEEDWNQAIEFLPDPEIVVVNAESHKNNLAISSLQFWNVRNGKLLRTIKGTSPLSISPDGKTLVSAISNQNQFGTRLQFLPLSKYFGSRK